MSRMAAALALLLAAALAGCSSSTHSAGNTATTSSAPAASTTTSSGSATSVAPRSAGPCGTKEASQVHYSHVIWVFMENHSYDTIIGAPSAPYINTLARSCGLATNYHNITHPSLPNYIASTSGLTVQALQPFTSDCDPSSSCDSSGPSIFGQGETWKAYAESMPSPCDRANSGEYAVRHNPAVYYTSLTDCAAKDVPYPMLAQDLASGNLPAFAFVTPNLIHDMHDGTVADGDSWLASNLPTIFSSQAYQNGTVAVFVTWDEGEGGNASNCAVNTSDVGCHVATLVVSPSTAPGTQSGDLYNHWSLLSTAEQLLHLPALGQAAGAPNMAPSFNL